MNKAYRVVWNETTASWVAASELACGRKKGASRKARLLSSFAAIALTTLTFGLAAPGIAEAGSVVANGTALYGTYDSATTDYYQYLYRNGAYAPTKGWDNQYALGAYVSIGIYASTKVNKADDAIFKLDGYNGNGRGGGVALGDSASVMGETGVALGAHSSASRNFSMALGGNSTAGGLGAIAMGRESLANGNYSIANGFVSTATGTGAISMGQSANASGLRSIAIGTSNQLSAAGNTAGDATFFATAANAAGTDTVSIGTGASTGGNNSVALGLQANTTSTGTNGVAVGNGASVSGGNGIAIGTGAVASGASALSVGTGNNVSGNNSGAFGDPNVITGNGSYAVGNNSTIGGDGSFSFGNSNTINGSNSAVVGSNGSVAAGQNDVFALGNNITSTASNSVVLGSNSSTTRANTVSVGSDSAQRQVVNMAAGTADTDAVNMSQLNATNAQVSQNTSDIAANTSSITNLNDRVTQNTTDIAGNTASITNLDGRVTQNTTDITSIQGDISTINNNLNSGTIGMVQQASAGADLTVGKDTDGAAVDFADKDGNTRTLRNVTAGVADTDAVNMSQLNATNAQVSQNTSDIAANTSSITNLDDRVTQNTTDIAGNTASITNLDGRVTQNTTDITSIQGDISTINNNLNSGTIGMVQQASAGADLTVGKDTDGAAVDFADKDGNTRTLRNVTAGVADTDAVNMSQLNATNAQVSQNTSDVAANTSSIEANTASITNLDGRVTQNTTDIAGNTASITDLDGRVTQNTTDITSIQGDISTINNNLNSGTIGMVQQASAGADLTVGKDTDGAAVDFADKDGNTRTLKNVTAGVADTDAVNMSQLNATNAQVSQNTSDIAANTSSIEANTASITNLDGRVTQNTTDIAGNTASITNLDGRVTQNTTDITSIQGDISTINNNLNSGTIGMVQQASAGADLTVGKDTDGAAVDFADKSGNTRTLKSVAAGAVTAASTDAVNGSQLHGVASSTASAMGGGAKVNPDGSISAPAYVVGGKTFDNVGDSLTNLDGRVTSLADEISSGSVGLVQQDAATRNITVANSTDGTVVDFAGTAGTRALTGVSAGKVNAASTDAVNGSQLFAQAVSTARALGGGSAVSSDGTVTAPSYVVGGMTVNDVGSAVTNLDGRVTQNTTDIASLQGNMSNLSGQVANAVAYDSSAHDSVTLGGNGSATAVALHNVAAGTATTDAVNVGQLNDAITTVTNIAQNGGTPMFAATGDRNSEVAAATGAHATAAGANAVAAGGQSTAVGAGAVARAHNSVALGAGSMANRDNSVSVGAGGSERQITNVAAGTEGTDAVNLNQLNNSIAQQSNTFGQQVGNLQSSINMVSKNAYAGVAAAMAMPNLTPSGPGRTVVAAGGGYYMGGSAAAVGVTYRSTNMRWLVNGGVSVTNTGNTAARAQVGYEF
ncbi:ESPR-type extended signal peptide-containing protein [Paraburkholderia sp. A1RI-2L]|uniref:ESPR-type extended signal peptide-containing protein n=1 Tax=Paraburkholderia sp. A1RI-2L TaxID=3028367 RepID=UPI003B787545